MAKKKDNLEKEEKMRIVKHCINKKDSLYLVPRKEVDDFKRITKKQRHDAVAIMTYGDYYIFLRTACGKLPSIPLSRFNYKTGTFKKAWGPNHKKLVLTPSNSNIKEVEIEIKGIDIRKMRLLPDKKGDVIIDNAKIKITRHYKLNKTNK